MVRRAYPDFSLPELLKDETSEGDLVGPTLQSLKIILDHPPQDKKLGHDYERLVHGLLSACLINVDEMR